MKYLRNLLYIFAIATLFCSNITAAKPKNIIVMIPDGCCTSLLSISRWYQQYHDSTNNRLAIDDHLCGLVRTHSSDAPIGDSAPTTSCYMSGLPSQTAFVSMYPAKTANDLIYINADSVYQPMATLMEAAQTLGKSTALVFTCEFPHATPADCSAHYYNRNSYEVISHQMVNNHIDVVCGGGAGLLRKYKLDSTLINQGYALYLDDKAAMMNSNAQKYWALFNNKALPYEMDRDATIPSLAEMTSKAINTLSSNPKGFFMMVEGSKVDWAAHANDAKALITEFLAFNDAVKAAIDFAKKDGNTMVIVLPDHGCSGISMGSAYFSGIYDRQPLNEYFDFLDSYTLSLDSLNHLINQPSDIAPMIEKYYGTKITNQQASDIWVYRNGGHAYMNIQRAVSKIIYANKPIAFTTFGHTGEDVFLAIYHPDKYQKLFGYHTNIEINKYLVEQMGLKPDALQKLTEKRYTPHTKLFAQNEYEITATKNHFAKLTIRKNNHTLELTSFDNFAILDGKRIDINSIIIYIDKNKTFYIPNNLTHLLK